jgi:large subunit ribosomal protein L29
MNSIDLKNMSLEELNSELVLADENFQSLKYNHSVAILENTNVLVIARRNVARLYTEIRKRELADNNDPSRDKIVSRRKRLKLKKKSK